MYTPMIETYGENNSINRAQTKKELIKKHENRLKEIQEISKGKNCVLSPELYINSFDPDMCEVYAYSYYDSGEDNISYELKSSNWYPIVSARLVAGKENVVEIPVSGTDDVLEYFEKGKMTW